VLDIDIYSAFGYSMKKETHWTENKYIQVWRGAHYWGIEHIVCWQ